MPIVDTIIGNIFFHPDDHATTSHSNLLWLFKRDFCGGTAMVFANTASVELDFSILELGKDEYRLWLTDLSLEGIYAVQIAQIVEIVSLIVLIFYDVNL